MTGRILLTGLLALAPCSTAAHEVDRRSIDNAERAAAMTTAAQAFAASLSPEQHGLLAKDLADGAARTDWSNLPSAVYPRKGLALGDLDDRQRRAFHDLLAASTSSQGYAKAATIMWIDDILRGIETERLPSVPAEQRAQRQRVMESRSSGNYWIAMFGNPASGRWGWMINGHHFAANFTVVEGRVAFTPLFLGANPQTIERGPYAGWRVLGNEIAEGFALFRSLTPEQRSEALVGPTVTAELFTGKGRKDAQPKPVGLGADQLDPDKRDKLMRLVEEFVAAAADTAAAEQMRRIRADGANRLHLAWWGSTEDPSQRFLYRIQGPSILIEFTREPDGAGAGNHVHAIVRDPRNDYGEDWLGRHYVEAPHP